MRRTLCGFNDGGGHLGADLLVQFGPTLYVDIGFDPNWAAGQGAPELAMKRVNALVDTGATESCIDAALAMQLNLPVVDRRQISGVGGAHEVNVHLAQIHVPSLPHTVYGAFSAVNLAAGGQQHLALIGRTFLRPFRLVYDGHTGSVSIEDPPAAP